MTERWYSTRLLPGSMFGVGIYRGGSQVWGYNILDHMYDGMETSWNDLMVWHGSRISNDIKQNVSLVQNTTVYPIIIWAYNMMTSWKLHTKYINGLDNNCSNSSALAMELMQSCTKLSISSTHWRGKNSTNLCKYLRNVPLVFKVWTGYSKKHHILTLCYASVDKKLSAPVVWVTYMLV